MGTKKEQNRQNQGLTYCRTSKKGAGRVGRTSTKYCPDCKMKIRGENHVEGSHHQKKSKS